jgi:hypothetical protein
VISKLDLGILAFLWCKGSKSDKLDFLYSLVKNRNDIEEEVQGNSWLRATKRVNKKSYFGFGGDVDLQDDSIVWSDVNLAHIFHRLFEFSIRLPRDLYDSLLDDDICDP